MKVIVTKMAFYAGARVRPGTVLDVPKDLKGSWFVPVDSKEAKAVLEKPEPKPEPATFSELANMAPTRAVTKPAA